MRRPQHLIRRGHTWYFRLVVPKPLRRFVGKTAFIKTLKTRDYAVALRRLPMATAEVQAALEAARRRLRAEPVTTLDDHQVRELAMLWLHDAVRRGADAPLLFDGAAPRADAVEQIGADLALLADPTHPDTMTAVMGEADRLLRKHNVSLTRDGQEYRKLCALLARAMVESTRRAGDRLRGDFGNAAYDLTFSGITGAEPEPASPTKRAVTVGELFDRFLADPTSSRGPKADEKYAVVRGLLGQFVELDAPAHTVE